jgi:2-polyprenyl-3-methyl-5-hydroxy-6-metoxy-1,4-benzoquinol methylase
MQHSPGDDFCPACKSENRITVAQWKDWEEAAQSRDGGLMWLKSARSCGYAAVSPVFRQCCDCRSIALFPVPLPQQLNDFYQDYHAVDSFLAKAEKKVWRARRRLFLLRMLVRGRRFLDVGASIGSAAEAARRMGFEATALELDTTAVNTGRDLYPEVEHIAGRIADLDKGREFDLIYAAEIIEHLPFPSIFADELLKRLAPGGLVFLTTPDAGHFRRPKNLMEWKSVKPPEHITLFTKRGLKSLFEAQGFTNIVFFPHAKPGVRMIARRPDQI